MPPIVPSATVRAKPRPSLGCARVRSVRNPATRQEHPMHWFDSVIQVVDLLGVLANAILGGMAARAARLDLVGFAIVATISGLGGGMIRDALLGGGPVVALTNPFYLGTA